MTNKQLKKLVKTAPQKSGIYLFKNSNKILYIGKALNLKVRLLSYLKTSDERILKMLSLANRIKALETDSDIEALILESKYIKKHKPLFNIMLRDDKQYFYVVFTKEKFPKVLATHQPHSKYRDIEISSFVGPFTDGTALKTTLRYLRRIFPYCTCLQLHNNFCLNYHIGKCPGFCCLKQQNPYQQPTTYNQRQYEKNIKAIKDILSGKKNSLLKNLEKEMVSTGKKYEFEKAIELQNKIEKVKKIFKNAQIIRNAENVKNNTLGIKQLAKAIGMKRLPCRIEGYDISNIQGTNATGSMVVFQNSQPDKNSYRKFKIHIRQNPDDTAMLEEIIIRRFNHSEWPYPDLILVDGGKQQLNMAVAVLSSKYQALSVPIIALTKDDKHRGIKIFITGKEKAIPLSQLPISVRNLLLQIDSEAHRFAISYYRKLHRRNLKAAL